MFYCLDHVFRFPNLWIGTKFGTKLGIFTPVTRILVFVNFVYVFVLLLTLYFKFIIKLKHYLLSGIDIFIVRLAEALESKATNLNARG